MKRIFNIVCIACLVFLTGCGTVLYSKPHKDLKKSKEPIQVPVNEIGNPKEFKNESLQNTTGLKIYYYNKAIDQLEIEIKQGEKQVDTLLSMLRERPYSNHLEAPISKKSKIASEKLIGNTLEIDFASSFMEEEDVLVAGAAIVNTMLENLEPVEYVKLLVDGKTYTLDPKNETGLLTRFPAELEVIRETGVIPGQEILIDASIYFTDITNRFVVSSTRKIRQGNMTELITKIIEDVEKGPTDNEQGYYPVTTFPLGLERVEYAESETPGAILYFGTEWKQAVKSSEKLPAAIASSLLQSINVEWVRFYYKNENGDYKNASIGEFDFKKRWSRNDTKTYQGNLVNVYFPKLTEDYISIEKRAIPLQSTDSNKALMDLIVEGPKNDKLYSVMPVWVSTNEIEIMVNGNVATVVLPQGISTAYSSKTDERALFYSIVNTFTDPMNNTGVLTVLFKEGDHYIEQFGSMDISEGLTFNTSIIKE